MSLVECDQQSPLIIFNLPIPIIDKRNTMHQGSNSVNTVLFVKHALPAYRVMGKMPRCI